MRKVFHIIGIIGTILFAIGSINWISSMLGLFGNHFYIEEIGTALLNFLLLIVFLILTIKTRKK